MKIPLIQYGWQKAFEWSGRKRLFYFNEIKDNDKKDRKTLEQIQFDNLKKLLLHAYQNVPYYSDVFNNLKISPDDIRSTKDLSFLPVLTKEIIRSDLNNFKPKNIPEANLILNHSGGSTGKPLSFYADRNLFEKMEASFLRSIEWAGYRPGDRIAYIWGAPQDLKGGGSFKKEIKSFFNGRYILGAYKYSNETMEKWVNVLKRKNIKFIYGYASVLSNFSKYIKSEKLDPPGMKAIITSAETLFPEARKTIEEVFNCKVYDQYGSREVISVASECEKSNMHILTDYVHVEFMKDDSLHGEKRAHEGQEPYKIVLTSFANYGTPFIRYDIGDYGIPKEGYCECGREFPLIERVLGRINDNFITPEGKIIYGTYFVRQMYGIKGVQSYQFHQTSKEEINLYIVKDKDFNPGTEYTLKYLKVKIANEISPRIRLNIIIKEEIPPNISGKHRYVISDVIV